MKVMDEQELSEHLTDTLKGVAEETETAVIYRGKGQEPVIMMSLDRFENLKEAAILGRHITDRIDGETFK